MPSERGDLFYQIIHKRVTRQIYTECRLFACEWDTAASKIVIPPGCGAERISLLSSFRERISAGVLRLSGIIVRLEKAGCPYHTDRVVELFNTKEGEGCFISFATGLIGNICHERDLQ